MQGPQASGEERNLNLGTARSSQWPYCTVFKIRLGCGVFFWRDEHVLEPEVVPHNVGKVLNGTLSYTTL